MHMFAYSLAWCVIGNLGHRKDIQDHTSVNCALCLRERLHVCACNQFAGLIERYSFLFPATSVRS